jgi:hypothetical protein
VTEPMMNSDPANQFVQAIAKRMSAMGLIRVGRSRTWLKDGGWRLSVVELQPSSWSKGSYLNVGSMFLFAPPDPSAPRLISFDAGRFRVLPFHPITTSTEAREAEEKFESAITAAIEAEESQFGTTSSAAVELANQDSQTIHDQYYTMLLLALTDRAHEAAKVATAILGTHASEDWMQRIKSNTTVAASLLYDRDSLDLLIVQNVQARRAELRLPTVSDADLRSRLA